MSRVKAKASEKKIQIHRVAAVAILLAITGCGGGGGGGGGGGLPILPVAGSNIPATQPPAATQPATVAQPTSSDPVLAPLAIEFELQPTQFDREKLLAALDSAGSKGFRQVALVVFSNNAYHLFSKDKVTGANYRHEFLNAAAEADFLSELNAKGAQGFQLMNSGVARRNSSASVWYSYSSLVSMRADSPESHDEFLKQLNDQGSKGNRYIGEMSFGLDKDGKVIRRSIYENAGGGRYRYEVLQQPNQDAAFLSQLNAEGGKGFRLNFIAYPNKGQANVFYVKDEAQSSTFTYWIEDRPDDAAQFLTQLTNQASRGRGFFVENYASMTDKIQAPGSLSPKMKNIYTASTQCKGSLCGDLGAFSIGALY